MVGDFNYGHINWENLSSQNNTEKNFIDKLQDNYLSQMVTVPTRKRGSDRSTMLDLIITKQPDKITDIDIRSPLGSSDHATIYFNIITEPKNINPIRSGLFQTANDPGGGGGGLIKSPPLRSRKLLCQSSPYHTCAFYQVF